MVCSLCPSILLRSATQIVMLNFHFQCQFGCVTILELSSIISCQNLNGLTGLITGHLSS